MNSLYLKLIKDGVPVIFDGAFGTQIQKHSLSPECFGDAPGCNEILNLNCPGTILSIHKEYLNAGANVVETNTFGGSTPKLREYGLEKRVYEINKAGAQIARRAVDQFKTDRPLFVCGSMGPTGFLPSSKDEQLKGPDFDQLASIFQEQAEGLLDGGADILLLETSQDLLEVRAALYGIRRLIKRKGISVPIQVQITVDSSGRMLLGSGITAFLGAVASLEPSVIGLNCGTGPDEVLPVIRELLRLSPFPVSALPNAGAPRNVDGNAVYDMGPEEFADVLVPLVTDEGLEVVGGCCGTGPQHIAALARRLKGKETRPRIKPEKSCWVSTSIGGVDLEEVRRPLIIGERLNTQGSKKTKELVIAENYPELAQIALEQQKCGATLVDLCVAITERDNEAETMSKLVSFLNDRIETPFCIDTTDPSTMKTALQANAGSVMLNSINLEDGGARAEKILELAREYGCPVIALTIDDEGMAKTVERKLSVARKLRDLACGKYGLPEHYLYIDTLVFTLATGDPDSADAALQSLEAIRRIKQEMPGVRTVMGVSNVSFGLKPNARRLLNQMLLFHAGQTGLDAAIFNPMHLYDPSRLDARSRQCADALLFNKNPDALNELLSFFDQKEPKKQVLETAPKETQLSPEKRLHDSILNRDRRNLSGIIEELLKTMSARDILNKILLPAMSEVGDKMSSGEIILPFVLQAAEVMKESVSILEPYLKGENSAAKSKLLLATVYGDVHDIGKNLVASILKNQGFNVIDLGKGISVETIVMAVRNEKPDAVGLSALLVTTSRQMARCAEIFKKEGISIPILIGGAAVNREFAERIAVLEDGSTYTGGIYYAKDAFGASKILESLSSTSKSGTEDKTKAGEKVTGVPDCGQPEKAIEYGPHLEPPFWGTSDILAWDPAILIDSLKKDRLFKAAWGGGKLEEGAYSEAVKNQFEPAFENIRREILSSGLLDPRGFYGFFPVITEGQKVIILDQDDFHTELAAFNFPRMPRKGCRSIADYFNPDGDVIGLQIVTIGKKLGDRCREYFQKEEKYSYGYFLHALGSMIVEDLASRITVEMRRGLGLESNIGKRYSFGYPGLPSLEEQNKLFDLMGIEERLGIQLTPGFQMDPEHSTLAIFVHHPESEYLC